MNIKKGTLIFSVILLAISIIFYWFCGIGTGLVMTLLLGAIILFDTILYQKNPRWWLVILILIISICFICCGFSKFIDNVCRDDTIDVLKETYIEEFDITDEDVSDKETDVEKETDEQETADEESEETTDVVDESDVEETSSDKESQDAKSESHPVVIERVVEKKVEVPVEKEVVKYVEVPAKSETTQTTKPAAKPTTNTTTTKPAAKPSTNTTTTQPATKPTTTTPNYNYNNNYGYYGYYGDPTTGSYGYGNNYGYSSDPTMNNGYGYGYGYGNGYGYYGDPTSNGYNNNNYYSSSEITGDTSVVAGNSYTYTITGVSSISKSKLDLPANVSLEKVSGNKVTLYFEEGWSGTYSIGYGSAELKIKVRNS